MKNVKKNNTSLIARLKTDYTLRIMTCSCIAFTINVIFAVTRGIAGFVFSSYWLFTLAAYYLILSISRILLLHECHQIRKISDENEQMIRQWKAYRACGIFLVVMTILLQVMVVLMLRKGFQNIYGNQIILIIACYDLYCVISSVIYLIRNFGKHLPVLEGVRSIRLAISLVSMLSLQTAMLAYYGNAVNQKKQFTMNLVTGSIVCLIIFAFGSFMMIHGNRMICKRRSLV